MEFRAHIGMFLVKGMHKSTCQKIYVKFRVLFNLYMTVITAPKVPLKLNSLYAHFTHASDLNFESNIQQKICFPRPTKWHLESPDVDGLDEVDVSTKAR